MKAVAAAVLMFVSAAPTADIRHFRFERPIETAGAGGQTCVAIDPLVFAHAAGRLADIRVYSGTTEAPYVVELAQTPTVAAQQLAPLNLGRRSGATVFDAAMPEGRYSDVELSLQAHDFIATVTVTGSQEEGAARRTRVGAFTVFDLSKQKLGRSTILHLPTADFRFLHFRIDGPVAPEEVTGITAEPARTGQAKYASVAQSNAVVRKGRTSIIQFDLPPHTPVDRIEFGPGPQPANFSRDVTVTVKAKERTPSEGYDRQPRTETAAGNVMRLHRMEGGHRIDEERLSLETPAWAPDDASTWVVTVENGDDPPIAWQSVRLEMVQRNLCFDAAAGARYNLYYGDRALDAPEYDYARLFVAQDGAAGGRLGAEVANSDFEPRPDDRPFTDRHPALLWIALGAVLLLLGGVALQTARRGPTAV